MKELINKILIRLRVKKSFIWTPPQYEVDKLKNAYEKIFKPTLDCLNKISQGGDFQITLSYINTNQEKFSKQFPITIFQDNQLGLKFKIKLTEMLNVDGVNYKESYGLSNELTIERNNVKFNISEDSVKDFKTNFPLIPQFLEGRFLNFKSFNHIPDSSYCRLIIRIENIDMIYPTSILEYEENYMKFDIPDWDRQQSLLGIPFLSIKGMYSELTIKKHRFHYYALEPLKSQVIDSIDRISLELFRNISYAIRLCFAFLSGKFYKDEVISLFSNDSSFSKIDCFDYKVEGSSILTENQIINPNFFFDYYSKKDKETQDSWKEFHKMFNVETFSSICENILDSPDLMRSIELVVNAGNIVDPVQKGALYSVSIETITEFLKSQNEGAFKPIQEKQIWTPFLNEVKDCLNKIKDSISDDSYKILNTKIENLNSPTNREKLVKPFKLVGIELSEQELQIVEKRNTYLHGGQPEDKNWVAKSNINALQLHYLIGMLVLKQFNYSGHYINVSGWFLLHNREVQRIMKKMNFEELQKAEMKIKNKDFESIEQIDEAKQIFEDLEKLNTAWMEIENLIKII